MSSSPKFKKEDIIAREARHAVFCKPPDYSGITDDLHFVKEVLHVKVGDKIELVPTTKLITNFERNFWITKKGLRNHKDKKEFENLENVDEFTTTQSRMNEAIMMALGNPGGKSDYRFIARSPYLYGSDILSTALIKQKYTDKWPKAASAYTVAAFDVETDVLRGTNEIIMASLTFGSKCLTVINKVFFEGQLDVEAQLRKALIKYLPDYVEKRKLDWEIKFVDNEALVVIDIFNKAHEWKPDLIEIWNIDFDIQKALAALERFGYDPKNVFSDPSVPTAFRHFYYKQGPKKKKKANGDVTPIKPADQWHTVFTPASFYFIDGMCVYRKIRMAKGEEQSYSLDYILDKELGIRKLNFKEAEGLVKLKWHQFMQSKYKIEYVIYNLFDCISMEVLDEKTNDLRIALSRFSGPSDFETFKSQPRRTSDALHFEALKKKRVFGSTSDQMTDVLDKHTLGLEDWITTLPAHLVVENGLRCVEEDPHMVTNIRGHVGDLDVAASYPNGECVMNISKETTFRELCKIRGVPETVQRAQGINLSGGHVNAVEICTTLLSMATLEELSDAWDDEEGDVIDMAA